MRREKYEQKKLFVAVIVFVPSYPIISSCLSSHREMKELEVLTGENVYSLIYLYIDCVSTDIHKVTEMNKKQV